MKEESTGKKVDQFWEIYIWERTLYFTLSFILNQWKDFRIWAMWWNLWVLVTARAAEFMTSWERLVCVADRLSRRELQYNYRPDHPWYVCHCSLLYVTDGIQHKVLDMFKSKGHSNCQKLAADSNTINVVSKTNEIVAGYADMRTTDGYASLYWSSSPELSTLWLV